MLRLFTLILLSSLFFSCSPEYRSGEPSANDFDSTNGSLEPSPSDALPFSEVVEKVFKPSGCFDCHGKYKTYATMAKIVVPGSPETSRLFLRASTDMPPIEEGYLPLSTDQLELLRQWILQGARE